MNKRLVKVAKELNVGTASIVDFLTSKGYEIDNKPIAKVTPEMQDVLREEFSRSASIKEKADQLEFGTRPGASPRRDDTPASVAAPPKPTPAPPAAPKPVESAPAQAEATPNEPGTRTAPGLKVLGKINLDERRRSRRNGRGSGGSTPPPPPAPKPAAAEQKPAEPAKKPAPAPEKPAPAPAAKAEPVKQPETAAPAKEKETVPAPAAKVEPAKPAAQPATDAAPAGKEATPAAPAATPPADGDTIRTKTPELRGLKIMGKIELKTEPKRTKSTTTDSDPNKRRRKRKKVLTDRPGGGRPGSTGGGRPNTGRTGGGRRDEPKEVSAKEIEEKIKATMARLQGGTGKKRRQRQRRDNRERLRERQEERDASTQTDKLQVTEFVSVSELAGLMDVGVGEVIMACMNAGVIVSINQRLDAEIIELVATEFDHEVEFINAEEDVEEEEVYLDNPEDLRSRAPIVTVMGHVDHGKTSLLDYIRKTQVTEGEAGGITQHIGAYEVKMADGHEITFLDTPGHAAFTAMRARGAKVTDIAIIIIAADDNIMPQTKEAISHAEAAGVPMVFAINKIDKEGANPERIKQELASMNYLVEDWGGKYQSQDISALKGSGVDDLLEKVVLEAELLELKANPSRPAVGAVLEASLEKGRGYVAKSLIQTGTLRVGDVIVAGESSGRVKAMFDEHNKRVKEATPAMPVLILGLDGAPQAGEAIKVMESEQEARQLAGRRAQINREQANRANRRISLDEIGRRLALGNFKELNLIVKGDFDGSVEALSDSLIKLSQETVQVKVIHKAVGQIIESDVLLASASDALILGFQVRPSAMARKLAEREGVEIKTYSIIYEAIEEIKMAIEGMLDTIKEERPVAQVEVREVFKISKIGTIAGCYVDEGKIARS
ncbi:MAG: translation initiation factor IF-2, partial [Saprospiraceae bacterium]